MSDSTFTRRDVIRRGGGLLVAASVGQSVLAATARAAGGGSGTLRVAVIGGAAESLDPDAPRAVIDVVRLRQVYNRLAEWGSDGKMHPSLATEFIPNKTLDSWVVKLRSGVEWHNGKSFTADDVVYSIKRIIAPANKFPGGNILSVVNPSAIQKLDAHTVRIGLNTPYSFFEEAAGDFFNSIVPAGQTTFTDATLVGTGPWILTQHVPGQSMSFKKNPNYFVANEPRMDNLTITYIADATARVSALQAGQVDAIEAIPATEVQPLASAGFGVLKTKSGHWTPLVMDVTQAPFKDVRVRQAMKLLADRKQLLESALLGYGKIGNDVFGLSDPLYAGAELPQYEQNISQAKSLLKKAGQSGLAVSLYTADISTGAVESALIFAQQAAKAGVKINVVNQDVNSYYASSYLVKSFYYTDWADRSLDPQVALCLFKGAPFNETKWSPPGFVKLIAQARRASMPTLRDELYKEAQKQLHDDGGYLIWGFPTFLDAYSSKVHGLLANPARALGNYGFATVTVA